MPAIFFALISYFSWGTGVLFEAVVARRMASLSLIFWSFALSFFLSTFYVPFEIERLSNYTIELLLLNVILALVALLLGSITYYEALKRENRALVGTIASSFPFITVIASVVFLGERLSHLQTVAVSLILMGLLFSIIDLRLLAGRRISMSHGMLLAVATMISWGLYFTFIKLLVEKVGWFWPNYIGFMLFPIVLLYMRFRGTPLESFTKNKVFFPLVFSTVLVRVAEYAYNIGISSGLVTVVAPIAGANPTLFVLLAFIFFKDPITKQQIVGIVTTLIGIVLLSFLSV